VPPEQKARRRAERDAYKYAVFDASEGAIATLSFFERGGSQ
jgi:hypothetical protein